MPCHNNAHDDTTKSHSSGELLDNMDNQTVNGHSDKIHLFDSSNHGDATPTAGGEPWKFGRIHEIVSTELGGETRRYGVLLPPHYNAAGENESEEPNKAFPVVYLLDGLEKFKGEGYAYFCNIGAQYGFCGWPGVNKAQASIIVGIENISYSSRQRDMTFERQRVTDDIANEQEKEFYEGRGGSAKFMSFIEKELMPVIENNYRTDTSARTIIGHSLAGLLATEFLLKRPNLFSKYVILSPSLWWDNGSLLDVDSEIFSESFKQKTDVYVAVANEGMALHSHRMEVDAILLAETLKKKSQCNGSLNVHFEYFPQESHMSVIHIAVYNAFRFLYRPQHAIEESFNLKVKPSPNVDPNRHAQAKYLDALKTYQVVNEVPSFSIAS